MILELPDEVSRHLPGGYEPTPGVKLVLPIEGEHSIAAVNKWIRAEDWYPSSLGAVVWFGDDGTGNFFGWKPDERKAILGIQKMAGLHGRKVASNTFGRSFSTTTPTLDADFADTGTGHTTPRRFVTTPMAARIIQVKVTPRARESSLTQLEDGTWVARLKSPPTDGKANAELIALVAKQFGCAKSAVSIKRGTSGRLKLVRIEVASTA